MRLLQADKKNFFRTILLTVLLVLPLVFVAGHLLRNYHTSLMDSRKQEAHNLVTNAFNLLYYYANKVEAGELDLESAQRYTLESVKNISPRDENYYWIMDENARMLMHPIKPELDGHEMLDYTGPDGQFLFRDMLNVVRNHNEGYTFYMWEKPGMQAGEIFSKISYIKLYEPWGWIIGTGVYVDDINRSFWNAIAIAGAISLAILLFLASLGVIVRQMVKKPS